MIIPRLWLADDTQALHWRQEEACGNIFWHPLTGPQLHNNPGCKHGQQRRQVGIITRLGLPHSLLTALLCSYMQLLTPDNPMMFSNHGPSPALPPVTNSYRTIIMITLVKTRRMFCFTTILLYQGKFWRVIKREGLRLSKQDGCGRGQFPWVRSLTLISSLTVLAAWAGVRLAGPTQLRSRQLMWPPALSSLG